MKLCRRCNRCYEDEQRSCSLPGHGPLIFQRAGTRLVAGKYRLIRLLGHGATGAVYEARHIDLRRPCAVKLLRADFDVADPYGKLRLRREALTACKFNHPNLVRIDDFGTNQVKVQNGSHTSTFEELFIAMELLEGESLKSYLRRNRKLTPRDAVLITLQIIAGLIELHAQGVVHRDLKPANIMLTIDRDGNLVVKVVDFGSVKLAIHNPEADDIDLTKGMFLGSALYTSPEMCRARPLDQRSDLYSVGLMLYEMLAGYRAFDSPDWLSLLNQHAFNAPPALVGIAAPLENIVMKALEKEPGTRIQSAAEFARLLTTLESPESNPLASRLAEPVKIDKASSFQESPTVTLFEGDEEETRLAAPKRNEKAPVGTPPPRAGRSAFKVSFGGAVAGSELRGRVRTAWKRAQHHHGDLQIRLMKRWGEVRKSFTTPDPTKGGNRIALAGTLLMILLLFSAFLIGRWAIRFPKASNVAEAQPITNAPTEVYAAEVGDEAETTTDVNIRASHTVRSEKVGLAEVGSRVRVTEKFSNWRRISVLKHGREKSDPESLDEGWIDGTKLRAVNE